MDELFLTAEEAVVRNLESDLAFSREELMNIGQENDELKADLAAARELLREGVERLERQEGEFDFCECAECAWVRKVRAELAKDPANVG